MPVKVFRNIPRDQDFRLPNDETIVKTIHLSVNRISKESLQHKKSFQKKKIRFFFRSPKKIQILNFRPILRHQTIAVLADFQKNRIFEVLGRIRFRIFFFNFANFLLKKSSKNGHFQGQNSQFRKKKILPKNIHKKHIIIFKKILIWPCK